MQMPENPESKTSWSPQFGARHAIDAVVHTIKAQHLAWKQKHIWRNSINEEEAFGELSKSEIDGFYHNAGSQDRYPGRFQKGINNESIANLELDVLSYGGHLVGAHDLVGFDRYLRINPKATFEQSLRGLVEQCIDHNKGINFDLKFESFDQYSVNKFSKFVAKVDTEKVYISGRNWKHLNYVSQRAENVTTLYTIDGAGGNNWGRFEREVLKNLPNDLEKKAGVSLRGLILKKEMAEKLNDVNAYSLIFFGDTAQQALYYSSMGVDGITSNNELVLEAIGRKKDIK